MTAEFTQGYPDWGRVLAANPQPFVNQFETLTANLATFGPFPIAAWRSVFCSFYAVTVNMRLELLISHTPAIGDAFFIERFWTTPGLTRNLWVPLVGQFLFFRPVLAGGGTAEVTLSVVPVPYEAGADRKLADLFLLSNSVSVTAAATHTDETLDVYNGPIVFTWSSNATAWTIRLRWRDFGAVLHDFFFANNTHVGRADSPWFLYVPDGRVRLEFTNSGGAAAGLTYAAVPQKPYLGGG